MKLTGRFKISGNTLIFYPVEISASVAEINQLNDNVLTSHLTLHVTDIDGDTKGDIWYDESENKIKFKTASGVETITSA